MNGLELGKTGSGSFSPGLYCGIFDILSAHPQLNCTSKITCIFFAANSMISFQYSSSLIHLILFALLSLLKLPSANWWDIRKRYFLCTWRVGGRNNDQAFLCFLHSRAIWPSWCWIWFISRRAWYWKYSFKQKYNDYKYSFLLEGGVKTGNIAKNVSVFSVLVAVPLKRVRQTVLSCVYCVSIDFSILG